MRTTKTRSTEANLLRDLLEEIRLQGTNDISKPVFYVICAVTAICIVLLIVLLSNIGIDAIRAYLPTGGRFTGLILLSLLIVWIVKSFVKLWLSLWTMTKEDE